MLARSASSRQALPLRRLVFPGAPQLLPRCSSPGQPQPYTAASARGILTARPALRPWKRKRFGALLGFERRLATALGEFRQHDDIQFEGLPFEAPSTYSPRQSQPRHYELKPFNTAEPLMVTEPPGPRIVQRMNIYGVPGDVEEMLSIFDACVHVGRLDRAAMVLKRFANMNVLTGEETMELHNRYLRERLAQIQADPTAGKADDIHSWFELQIRAKALPPSSETVACLIKAALITSEGARLQRLVARYMDLLPQESALEHLFSFLGDVLTEKDLADISELCPAYNMPTDLLSTVNTDQANALPSGPSGGVAEVEKWLIQSTSEVPRVRPTPQDGLGLKMLQQTLSLFDRIPEGRDIASLTLSQRREIQSKLEKDCVDAALARWRLENQALLDMGLNTSLSGASLNARLYEWQTSLEAWLTDELKRVDQSEKASPKCKEDLDRCVYGPFLRQSTPARLAAVTILGTLSALATTGADNGMSLSHTINHVSKVAEEDIRSQRISKQQSNKGKSPSNNDRRPTWHQAGPQSASALEGSAAPTSLSDSNPTGQLSQRLANGWPLPIRTKVGAALVSALITTAKITAVREHPETKVLVSQLQPAFFHGQQLKRGKKVGMIQPNKTLIELMKREPKGYFLARQLPMVVEPKAWTRFDQGGFLEFPTDLVRIKQGERDQKIYTEAAIARGDMDQVLRSLDILGKTAWKINRKLLDVMLQAWNTGEEFANLPALEPQIPAPVEPDSSEDPMLRRAWLKEIRRVENMRSGKHSERCFINFQLEIARAFRDQTFYFPHNIDFRGRAYPMPTYLNHMGADHARSLLLFAKGKPLGESGLRWLKVHLANVFGYDKASFVDRENFALQEIDNIRDSCARPLEGKRWWLQAEDPWQCLATCYELLAALDLPDPTQYVSHLPVHQDGTCNGLQHYAALGGDSWGARQVNLEPGDKPADVYTAVADLVNESIAKDLKVNDRFAQILTGKINRKVVKQTVMTNVYGVTFIGAKKQIQKQLTTLYPDLRTDCGIELGLLASYIATKVFAALSTMFSGAHQIQTWLGEIGGRVCRALTPEQILQLEDPNLAPPTIKRGTRTSTIVKKAKENAQLPAADLTSKFRSTLIWTTPLRMPVVQPYRKSGTRTIMTCLQELVLTQPDRDDPVNRRKQLQAFPPNFIHSLDASHMMLSALECDELGLTFAAVHDSFWTHASDVDAMNGVIRDSFIRIHSENVIGRLAEEFEARYKNSLFLAKVYSASPVGAKIQAWRKATRMNMREELLAEKRRQVLLASTDPEEVAKGREMETPASFFENMSAGDDLVESDDLGPVLGLGSMPTAKHVYSALSDTSTDEDGPSGGVVSSGNSDELHEGREEAEPEQSSIESGTAEEEEQEEQQGEEQGSTPSAHLQQMIGNNNFAVAMTAKGPHSRGGLKTEVALWLPLTFPPIPPKGDFDVRRLKTSKYFFS
ncbi:hypothetical protein B0T22DRAFT_458984 [Podospora appendiculata]|uniref:DNA-directed RNA polymerase n=1 Tax=Podospora appendiculata TaxID=314037 RepID=A0AAE0X8V4_9PEZI|nr:hypothetical protein B0T22DRAFT_458984 [Podospora appendiculata]